MAQAVIRSRPSAACVVGAQQSSAWLNTRDYDETCRARRRAAKHICDVIRVVPVTRVIVLRAEATAKGLLRYFTGKPCIRGHVAERTTKYKKCMECDREDKARWRAERPGENAAYSRRWRAADPERARAGVRLSLAKWRPKNRHKKAAEERLRQARKLQRTPKWADVSTIAVFYAEAKELTEFTGVEWHVDHVIPLQGKLISGLHVRENLQLLPAIENMRKHNKFEITI